MVRPQHVDKGMFNKCGYSILFLTQLCVGHSNMMETVICSTNCILNICLVLLFHVLNMPSEHVKLRNLGYFYTPI